MNAQEIGLDLAFAIMMDVNNTGGITIAPADEQGIDESYFMAEVLQRDDTGNTF